MCRSRMATNFADQNSPSPHRKASRQPPAPRSSSSSGLSTRTSSSSSSSQSSRVSALASLRESLSDKPTIYHISEIRSATNNFLAKRYSSSSWRCCLRGKDVLVFQRKFHRRLDSLETLRDKLSFICKCHHVALVKLLGASASASDRYIYLVYEFFSSTNLADCLRRNPNNASFSVLSSWMSRIQIANDLANGLDYIHNNIPSRHSLVHNHINSSGVIIASNMNAKICHLGTAYLCGEPTDVDVHDDDFEFECAKTSNAVHFQGTGGYMTLSSPEMQATGIGSQRSDVFAFGVVVLELLSGQEPVRFKFDRKTRDYVRVSVIDAASEAVQEEGRLRRWLDGRLNDSFPSDVAQKLTRLALQCVDVDELKRPNMSRVAAKMSKLYLESRNWADKIHWPTDLTVSFGAR